MTQDKMKQGYNQTFFPSRIVDSWIITARTGAKHRVSFMDNNTYLCSCNAKSECYGVKSVKEWQENEKKEYQY